VDINVLLATGDRHRERRKLSASYSKTTAREWGERRERELLLTGPKVRKEVPTLEAFAPRFVDGYARANRQKPSGVAAKESILRLHLIPELGSRTFDTIANEQVQRLKLQLHDKSPKTINNVLSVLNVLLKQAVEWGVLDKMLCKDDGTPITRQGAWSRVRYAAKRAKVPTGVHILRHTFCSHLAMQGAPMRGVQELVGHQSLAMTQRYSHLSPAALDATIRLLENRTTLRAVGDSLETPKG
jgi:integrase